MNKPLEKKWRLEHSAGNADPPAFREAAPAQRIMVLKEYEEVVGPLSRLEESNGMLLAEIGKVVVALPIELKDGLSPNLNRRIAVLRTDLPGKRFLFRIICEEKPESDPGTVQVIAAENVHDELGPI
jgi:hypothetical protein